MASYNVLIKPSAAKEMEAVPRKERLRIIKRIQALAGKPRPAGCEKLSSQERYRLRQGHYRIIYSISDHKQAVLVVKIAHRREAYR